MAKTTIIACKDMGNWSVKLTQDEEGYGFYVLDGREWEPWAEAASLEMIENCVRGLPQVETLVKEDPRKDWKWNYRFAGKSKTVSERKVRNFVAKLLKGLEG